MKSEFVSSFDLSRIHYNFLMRLAFGCIQFRKIKESILIYESINAIYPGIPEVVHSLAHAKILNNQPDLALINLKTINDKYSNDPLTWLLRSQALSQLGHNAESAKAMRFFIRFKNSEK